MIDRTDSADRIDPKLAAEPIENAEPAEPIEPIDRTEPIEPTESTDPFDLMLRMEFSDWIDHNEPQFVFVDTAPSPSVCRAAAAGDAVARQ